MKTGRDNIQYSARLFGFTLIELLIVMGVITTLFAFGYGNYRDYARRQAILATARDMEATVRMAQSYAFSARKPATGCAVLDGYIFILSGGQYGIKAYCQREVGPLDQVGSLSGVSASPASASVIFKTLGHGTNLTSDVVITLTQTDTNYKAVLTISTSGEVKYELQ